MQSAARLPSPMAVCCRRPLPTGLRGIRSSRRACPAAASSSKQRTLPDLGSDVSFLARLAIGSAVGAAVVKYGSLVTDALFRPSAVAAAVLVVTPVIVYAGVLVVRGQQSSGGV